MCTLSVTQSNKKNHCKGVALAKLIPSETKKNQKSTFLLENDEKKKKKKYLYFAPKLSY